MLVLAVDTSTPVVTAGVVSVLRPHEILAAQATDSGPLPARSPVTALAERTVTNSFGHAEYLMPLIREALSEVGASLADLEAVVVGLGPGPFTGLRVGVATAQALGDARSLPVHGVPSHDGVALAMTEVDPGSLSGAAVGSPAPRADGLSGADAPPGFLVATDARRREVYVSGYRDGLRRVGPLVAAPADVAGLLPADLLPAWITGAAAGLLTPALGLPVREVAGSVSGGLVRAALRGLVTGAISGPLTPLYLRRPDATIPGAPKPVLPDPGAPKTVSTNPGAPKPVRPAGDQR